VAPSQKRRKGPWLLQCGRCLRTCVSVSDCVVRAWPEKESDAALSELIAKYQTTDGYQIGNVYAFRNQPDEAFEWLEPAYAQRDTGLVPSKVDPY
jgi:hypothetical protein